jgi:glycosyltransferase involved in cell wall biosynthesis
MKALVLVANARMPSPRAQSLQVAQCAAAFQRAGVDTVLLHARRRSVLSLPEGSDVFDYYAVPPGPRPRLESAACMDWIDRLPRALQYVPARLQEASFSRNAARRVYREWPQHTVLSREVECAGTLLRKHKQAVFLEIHRVPGGRLRRRALLHVGEHCQGVIAISGGVREDLLELGLAAEQITVEHDGFEATRFAAGLDREQARTRLKLPLEAPVVVYTGGLLAWKGVDVLLEAATRLPDVYFVIAGGMEADVQRLRGRAGGQANVRIDGFQPPETVPWYLAAGDLAVVPNRATPAISARYTSPLKVFEAMAVGIPLVASDLPALREILHHGQDAWLVPPEDPQALAQGIETLLADPTLARRLGAALRSRAAEHSWDARAQRLIAWMRARS